MFQSTPARGGRPVAVGVFVDPTNVSIHARARRATANSTSSGISIGFNPRPREAGDQCQQTIYRI